MDSGLWRMVATEQRLFGAAKIEGFWDFSRGGYAHRQLTFPRVGLDRTGRL